MAVHAAYWCWSGVEVRAWLEEVDVDYASNTSKLRLNRLEFKVYLWNNWCYGRISNLILKAGNVTVFSGEVPWAGDLPGYQIPVDSWYDMGIPQYTSPPIAHDRDGKCWVTISMDAGLLPTSHGDVWWYTNGNTVLKIMDDVRGASGFWLSEIPNTVSTIAFDGGQLGRWENIGINAANSTFVHDLSWKTDASGYTPVYSQTPEKSLPLVVPLEAANPYPDLNSIRVTFLLTTYALKDGSYAMIGSTEKAVMMSVPDEGTGPVFSGVWDADNRGLKPVCGGYVQGVSRADLAASVYGRYGAGIVSVTASLGGTDYPMNPGESAYGCTTNEIGSSGQVEFRILATDTRGKTAAYNGVITVLPYSSPAIHRFTVKRTDEDQTRYHAEWAVAKADIAGGVTVTITHGQKGQDQTDPQVFTAQEGTCEGGGILVDKSWRFRIQVNDGITVSEAIADLATAFATIDLRAGGKGVAVGGICSEDGMEVYMNTKFFGDIRVKLGNDLVSLADYIRAIINE